MSKREDILNATLDLVVEEGLASFSFSKLFTRAGVGAGTVYNYFDSKETLLEVLYDRLGARMDESLLAGGSPSQPLVAQLKSMLRRFAAHAVANPKDMAFIEACGRRPSMLRTLRQRATPGQALSLELIARAQKNRLVRPMEPYLALTIVSGLIVSVVAAARSGIYVLGKRELEAVIESSWRAVATDAGLRADRRTRRRSIVEASLAPGAGQARRGENGVKGAVPRLRRVPSKLGMTSPQHSPAVVGALGLQLVPAPRQRLAKFKLPPNAVEKLQAIVEAQRRPGSDHGPSHRRARSRIGSDSRPNGNARKRPRGWVFWKSPCPFKT